MSLSGPHPRLFSETPCFGTRSSAVLLLSRTRNADLVVPHFSKKLDGLRSHIMRAPIRGVSSAAMQRLSAWLVGTTSAAFLVLIVFVLGSSSAAPGDDVHYFQASVVGNGQAFTDFGEDRKQPGQITASGVDGTEFVQCRWEVRAVAKSVGAGPLITRAKAGRARGVSDVSVLGYGIQNGVLGEYPLCSERQGKTTFVTNDGRGPVASKSGRGEFLHKAFFRIYGGDLLVNPPEDASPPGCLHTAHGGLEFADGASYDEARVPRGAFNPRSDRSYKKTFGSPIISLGRDHATSDPNSAHTFSAFSGIRLEIKAISERRFNKRVKKFQHIPVGLPGSGITEYHDPPPPAPRVIR